jgi:hypothetical protein
MFSSSFAHNKHFGSISFLYILIRLLCSVVEIERLTGRLLYQLHIARYKVICC